MANESEITAFRKEAADVFLSREKTEDLLTKSASPEGVPDFGEFDEGEEPAEPVTLEYLARIAQSRAERRREQQHLVVARRKYFRVH